MQIRLLEKQKDSVRLEIVNADDTARRRTMIYGDFFTRSLQSLGFFRDSIAQCFECMRVCPVGRKYRKLK